MSIQNSTARTLPDHNQIYCHIKAIMDLAFALVLMALLWPLFLLMALIIRLDSKGPAIYRQARIGANGSIFTMYKFRTMKIGTPVLSTEDIQNQGISTVTRFGRILRKTSLDELPQLLNIIKSEMSFIGPRPALPTQDEVIRLREQSGADSLRPGITGLAQVKGRDDLADDVKVEYDSEYYRNLGLIKDLRILVRTFGAVVSSRGNK